MNSLDLSDKWNKNRVVQQQEWCDGLLSLYCDTGARQHKPGQFIRIGIVSDDKLISRAYSLVSTPSDTHSEIIYNIVPEGGLTPLLSTLKPQDEVYISKLNYGVFTLDEIPASKHLWCMGTGTGLGPYLPIIQGEEVWEKYEKVFLIHGVSVPHHLFHTDLIAQIKERHPERFEFVSILSQGTDAESLSGRITHNLENGDLEKRCGEKITPEDSQVMLCGNSGFISEVHALLIARGLCKNLRRTPGHITTERYYD